MSLVYGDPLLPYGTCYRRLLAAKAHRAVCLGTRDPWPGVACHLQQDSHFSIYKSFLTGPFVQVVVRDCEVVILDGSSDVILSGAKNLFGE